jgi:hypothetical protein
MWRSFRTKAVARRMKNRLNDIILFKPAVFVPFVVVTFNEFFFLESVNLFFRGFRPVPSK